MFRKYFSLVIFKKKKKRTRCREFWSHFLWYISMFYVRVGLKSSVMTIIITNSRYELTVCLLFYIFSTTQDSIHFNKTSTSRWKRKFKIKKIYILQCFLKTLITTSSYLTLSIWRRDKKQSATVTFLRRINPTRPRVFIGDRTHADTDRRLPISKTDNREIDCLRPAVFRDETHCSFVLRMYNNCITYASCTSHIFRVVASYGCSFRLHSVPTDAVRRRTVNNDENNKPTSGAYDNIEIHVCAQKIKYAKKK